MRLFPWRERKLEMAVSDAVKPKASATKIFLKRIFEAYKTFTEGRNTDLYAPASTFKVLTNAIKAEAYLRRARDRYVELIWKSGFDFVGSNPEAVAYIKRRFKEIGYVSGKPTRILFEELTSHLVLYYNCFIYKVRNENSSSGAVREFFGKTVKPVAGYYVWDCTNIGIRVDRDKKIVTEYEYVDAQRAYEKETVVPYADMIHMTIDRSPTSFFGEPPALAVLDDIRALRRMEERVEILVFQHIAPLFHYTVGTDERPASDAEVATVESTVQAMDASGMLVTPERHKIVAVGESRGSMDVTTYLEYYKARIFTGLGHSSVSIGEGGGANRATSQTSIQTVVDGATRFKGIIQTYVNEFMINELLLEGGFDVFSDDTAKVELFIPEIDIDAKIRKEYHALQLYQGGALDQNEVRIEIGRKPYTPDQIPYSYLEQVSIPTLLAKQSATDPTSSSQAKEGASRSVPKNQYGTKKVGPSSRLKESEEKSDPIDKLITVYRDTFVRHYQYLMDDVGAANGAITATKLAISVTQDMVLEKTNPIIDRAWEMGWETFGGDEQARSGALDLVNPVYRKAIQDFFAQIMNIPEATGSGDIRTRIEAQMYRIDHYGDWFIRKAYSMGMAQAAVAMKKTVTVIQTDCTTCKSHPDHMGSGDLSVQDVPPYHGHCGCHIQ